ncbi:MAG TPA: hypothetical protein VL993_13370 [Stellaceae bacterium]|nr:hypothetical protein [Stellaceae bacterium]
MASSVGIKEVSWLDCAGGGQVVIDGNFAYIGHIDAPAGTTIADVTDPKHPKIVSEISIPEGLHSHKVRAQNGIMVVNREHHGRAPDGKHPGRGGLMIYDVSNPRAPKQIRHWECDGNGVHRFTFDGRYAYISPQIEGYVGNIVMILDLKDPARPEEVGRWWMPGQWKAGGEVPSWKGHAHRCHHPIRRGNRLYTSYWHGGCVILDIEDMAHPKFISQLDWSPPFPWPTHSAVPIDRTIAGRRYMLVADEDVQPMDPAMAPEMSAFIWSVDITDEKHPVPVSTFQVEGVEGHQNPEMTGCHQPIETIEGNEVPCAWFSNGLRVLDVANPRSLREVAHYVPDSKSGKRVCSNDVYVDKRGLIYLIDRWRGLSILERP